MNPDSDTAANAAGEAAKTGELVRTTGERVETSFLATINELLLRIPDILAFILAISVAWLVGRLLGRWLARRFDRRGKTDLGKLLATVLTGTIVFIVACLR